MKFVLSLYLILAFLYYLYDLYKLRISSNLVEWVPEEYCKDLLDCRERTPSLFDRSREIPLDQPVLLIVGNVRTNKKDVRILDSLAKYLTFGYLRFHEIIPVGEPLSLRLYFKNISEKNFSIQGGETNFYIKYPEETDPSRRWHMEIPTLLNKNDCCFINEDSFFTPEVPGTHEFGVLGRQDLVYAGPFGLIGRRYRIPSPGAPWFFRFHVSSDYEHKIFVVAFFALAVAIISLMLTLIV